MGYAQLSEGRVEKLKLAEEVDRAIGQVADFKNPADGVIANFLNPAIDLKNPRFKHLEDNHE